jgi:hypothetical protein
MQSIQTLFSPSYEGDFSTKQTLTLIGLAGLASLLIAILPLVGLLNYPFRLLLTMVHELGHGLAALLTGGSFIRFVVFPNGSGLAYTAGGWSLLVTSAGYLAVAVFGAILILLGRNQRWSRIALGVIGGAMILLSLRYGVPSIFSFGHILGGLLTTFAGLIFGAFFIWVALKAAAGWIVFLIHLVAIQAGLTAFSDLTGLIGLSTRFFNTPANDAQSMAEMTFVPAVVWALLWVVVAVLLIGGAIWLTWLRPSRKFNGY